jgi:hypothetical protein
VKEAEQQLAAVKQQLDRATEGLEAAARYRYILYKGEGGSTGAANSSCTATRRVGCRQELGIGERRQNIS